MYIALLLALWSVFSVIKTSYGGDKNCAAPLVKCPNGKCINSTWLCDGEDDCKDNWDELNCTSCPASEFQCGNGICIPDRLVCDNIDNCQDYSDESNCGLLGNSYINDWFKQLKINQDQATKETNCSSSSYTCEDGKCIPQSWVCDGKQNCNDNEDELNCKPNCSSSKYMCNDGRCIPQSWVCDGEKDCSDNKDELNCVVCHRKAFRCANGQCIPNFSTCDGDKDCEDNSDESACAKEDSDMFEFSHCDEDFCQNGGQCVIINKVRICRCPNDYNGEKCEKNDYVTTVDSKIIAISISVVALVFSIISITVWLCRKKYFSSNISATARKFVVYFYPAHYSNRHKILSDLDEECNI